MKQRSLEEMRELMRLRVEMFNKLRSSYARDVEHSSRELEDEISTLHIVENELKQAREQLEKLNDKKVNKMRMVEISTYFSEKYKAYNSFFKLIMFWMVILGILIFIAKRNPISERHMHRHNSNSIFLLIIMVVFFYGLYQVLNAIYDLVTRDNMNFSEYNFDLGFDYDKAVSKYNVDGNNMPYGVLAYDKKEFEDLADDLHLGCIDSTCCADGTIYDSIKKRCILASNVHKDNNQKASLTKGTMGAVNDEVTLSKNDDKSVEAFTKQNVPFSSV